VLAVLAGAVVGAALYLHIGAWLRLAIAAATAAATTSVFWRSRGPAALDAA
jgi:hypothetical protein